MPSQPAQEDGLACCNFPTAAKDCDGTFTVDAFQATIGRGCLAEVGGQASAKAAAGTQVADVSANKLLISKKTHASLSAAGLAAITYTNVSFLDGAGFAQEMNPDGYASLVGGSVIDTCKTAKRYTTYPAGLLTRRCGKAIPVPGPLKPHISYSAAAFTGSEITGITIFNLLVLSAKTGIASQELRPAETLVDPACTANLLPRLSSQRTQRAVALFRVLHARTYVCRLAPEHPSLRPMTQGTNPWSNLGYRAMLRLLSQYFGASGIVWR